MNKNNMAIIGEVVVLERDLVDYFIDLRASQSDLF